MHSSKQGHTGLYAFVLLSILDTRDIYLGHVVRELFVVFDKADLFMRKKQLFSMVYDRRRPKGDTPGTNLQLFTFMVPEHEHGSSILEVIIKPYIILTIIIYYESNNYPAIYEGKSKGTHTFTSRNIKVMKTFVYQYYNTLHIIL